MPRKALVFRKVLYRAELWVDLELERRFYTNLDPALTKYDEALSSGHFALAADAADEVSSILDGCGANDNLLNNRRGAFYHLRDEWKKEAQAIRGDVLVTSVGFFGNSGAGKSTLANCFAEEVVFEARLGCGIGVTADLTSHEVTSGRFSGKRFFDAPGLADEKNRKAAVRSYNKLLTKQRMLKPIVVIRPNQGRIAEEDKTTMKLLLGVAPEIGRNYAIILNQCGPRMMKYSRDPEWRKMFEEYLLDGLPNSTDHIYYQCKLDELDEAENSICKLDEGLLQWLEQAPAAMIETKEQRIPEEDFMGLLAKCNANESLLEELTRRQESIEEEEKQKQTTACANLWWVPISMLVAFILMLPAFLTLLKLGPFCKYVVNISWSGRYKIPIQLVLLPYYMCYACYRLKQVVDHGRRGQQGPDDNFTVWGKVFYLGLGYVKVKHMWVMTRSIDAASDWLAYASFIRLGVPDWVSWTWFATSVVSTLIPVMYSLSQLCPAYSTLTFAGAVFYLLVFEDIEQCVIIVAWETFGSSVPVSMPIIFSSMYALLGVIDGVITNRQRLRVESREMLHEEFNYVPLV